MSERKRVSARVAAEFISTSSDWDASTLRVTRAENPAARNTLGDLGLAVRVAGREHFPATILRQPVTPTDLVGFDRTTLRTFRFDGRTRQLVPVWASGLNEDLGYIWTEIRRPGVYVPIALPRDRLLQSALRWLAEERKTLDPDSAEENRALNARVLASLLEAPEDATTQLRKLLTKVELQTGILGFGDPDIQVGDNASIDPFPLPRALQGEGLRTKLKHIIEGGHPLSDEQLFFPPDSVGNGLIPWPVRPTPGVIQGGMHLDPNVLERLDILHWPFPIPWLFSADWWMYHHDRQHTGHASGSSQIKRTNVSSVTLWHDVPLDGDIVAVPALVGGYAYVGTGKNAGGGGTLYKINLWTGAIVATFSVNTGWGAGSRQGYPGIGCAPAVIGGRVYFSALDGKVYCLNATNLTLIWVTDIRNPDPAHNQPVQNVSDAEGWSSPVIADGNVFIGAGEGETDAFGFIYCLDAQTGNVRWIFCTNKFAAGAGADNSPNVIPVGALPGGALPAWSTGYTTHADPPGKGASPWSSACYSGGLHRLYIGTGNPLPQAPLPSTPYSAGLLALDGATGNFAGFFQPDVTDSYRPQDNDIDVPAGPTLYWQNGVETVAFGSKNGAFFLLRADNLAVIARRQLLPKDGAGNPLPNVDPYGGSENHYGVFGSAGVDYARAQLFVALGGYSNSIDYQSTPFLRAMNWSDLTDTWATSTVPDGVSRYTVPKPPLYTTPWEAGLSSPAVVNDVVFVTTTKPGFYALDAGTGLCLWSAPGLPTSGWRTYVMGPAIYHNYVVIGCGVHLRIYLLWRWFWWPWLWWLFEPNVPWHWPWPLPPPIWWGRGTELGPPPLGSGPVGR